MRGNNLSDKNNIYNNNKKHSNITPWFQCLLIISSVGMIHFCHLLTVIFVHVNRWQMEMEARASVKTLTHQKLVCGESVFLYIGLIITEWVAFQARVTLLSLPADWHNMLEHLQQICSAEVNRWCHLAAMNVSSESDPKHVATVFTQWHMYTLWGLSGQVGVCEVFVSEMAHLN